MRMHFFVRLMLSALLLPVLALSLHAQSGSASVSADFTVLPAKLYQGQVFQGTLTIRSSGVQLSRNMSITPFGDPLIRQLRQRNEVTPQQRMENGQPVLIQAFEFDLIAEKAGTAQCAPVLTVGIYTRSQGFFFGQMEESRKDIPVTPFTIAVLPLPEEGKPAGFSEAVGQFNFQAVIPQTNISAGDVVKMLYLISGTGNLDKIIVPSLKDSSQFKTYPVKPAEPRAEGTRAFEQYIVPASTNSVTVPGIEFSYFDPVAANYRRIMRGPFTLNFVPRKEDKTETFRPTEWTPGSTGSNDAPASEADSLQLNHAILLLSTLLAALVVTLAFALVSFLRKTRPAPFLFTAAVLILLLIPLSLYVARRTGWSEKDVVQLSAPQAVMLAPSYNSRTSFELPANSSIRVLGSYSGWLKVQSGSRRGWIPEQSLPPSASGAAPAPAP
jgi:hypothetical protein